MKIILILFLELICLAKSELFDKLQTSGIYSIQILSSVTQNVAYEIDVNGVIAASGQVSATSDTPWINFTAKRSDVINITLVNYIYPYYIYYVVKNAANGGGTEIYNSKSTTWTPVNFCSSQCTYVVTGPDDFGSSKAKFYVNDVLVCTFEGSEQSFTVNVGDLIRVDFTFDSENPRTGYLFGNDEEGNNSWIYNAYGMSTRIDNSVSDRTPFGGFYSPITDEQVREFAVAVGAGNQNSVWIPLTYPYDA